MRLLKRITSGVLCCIILCLSVAGCSKKALGDSPVPLEPVTQNSRNDFITFAFGLPSGWETDFRDYYIVAAANVKEYAGEEDISLILEISNYCYSGLFFKEEREKAITALFNGETDAYIDYVRQSGDELMSGLGASAVELTDFEFQFYRGTYGNMVEVRHTETFEGKTICSIVCYREDIPYQVTGAFHDSDGLSSGDIVPWVADSLQVTEHFQKQSETAQG